MLEGSPLTRRSAPVLADTVDTVSVAPPGATALSCWQTVITMVSAAILSHSPPPAAHNHAPRTRHVSVAHHGFKPSCWRHLVACQVLIAWRRARKHHLRELGAAARHNLLALCIETGRFDEAQEHAEAAFELYGKRHRIIPTFAQDVAQLWSWQGYSDVALRVFSAALPRIEVPKERFITTANLGRAAAGAGRGDLFLDAWGEITRYTGPMNEFVAEALVNIGEGALILGLHVKALEAATRALHLATARRERATVDQAERVLARIRAGETGRQRSHAPPDRARSLAGRLLRALEAAPAA
jgi:tetratricopeptide (TPR) repeat protein